MKKLLVVLAGLILIVAAVIVSTGCGGGDGVATVKNPVVNSVITSSSQENVIREFYRAIDNGDFKKASELTTFPDYNLSKLTNKFVSSGHYIHIEGLNVVQIDLSINAFQASYYVKSDLVNGYRCDDVRLIETGGLWRIENIYDSILW